MIWKLLKFHHIRPEKTKKEFFGHFRLSEGYTHLKRPIVKPFLWSFSGVNQFYMIGDSQDMKNHKILPLYWLSEEYRYQKIPIVNQVLWLI